MGCGTSRTIEKSKKDKSLIEADSVENINFEMEHLKYIQDKYLQTYFCLIENGLVYIDYQNSHFKKDEMKPIKINQSYLVFKTFKGPEAERLLQDVTLIFSLRKKLKRIDSCHELGINYDPNEKNLVLFLIFNPRPKPYLDSLFNCLETDRIERFLFPNLFDFPLHLLIKLINSLKQNKNLKNLTIMQNSEFDMNTLLNNLVTSQSLEHLKITNLGLTSERLGEISPFLMYNKSLKSIDLEGNKIDSLKNIADYLKNRNICLKSLLISGNKFQETESIGEILNLNMQKLQLAKINLINEKSFSSLKLDQLQNLNELDLSFNWVDLNVISNVLFNNRNLIKLVLNKIKFSEHDSQPVINFGKSFLLSNLENLHLSFNHFDIKHFFAGFDKVIDSSLIQNKKKKLKLFKTEIYREKCEEIFTNLTKFDVFETLDFSFCHIIDYDKFCEKISSLKNLNTLNISNHEIDSKKLNAITHLLFKKGAAIKTFDFESNPLVKIEAHELEEFYLCLANSQVEAINFNFSFTEKTSSSFGIFMEKFISSKLTSLKMDPCYFDSNNFGEYMRVFLLNNDKLKVLKIGSKDEIYKPANNSLFLNSPLPYLHDFSLNNINVDQENLSLFISNSPLIEHLCLKNVCTKTKYFESFLKLKNLKDLKIESWSIKNDNHAKTFKKVLEECRSIQTCEILVNIITPYQFESIIEGIQNNKNLKFFKIHCTEDKTFESQILKFYESVKTSNLHSVQFHFLEDSQKNQDGEYSRLTYDEKYISLLDI
jgi:hypothetical protein